MRLELCDSDTGGDTGGPEVQAVFVLKIAKSVGPGPEQCICTSGCIY